MSQQDPVSPAAVGRLAALGGLGFAVASIAGDLVIGPFPRPATPASQLVPFYAAHHAQVLAGGMLLGLGGVLFVPFGLAVWARIRQAPGSHKAASIRSRPGTWYPSSGNNSFSKMS